MRDEAGQLIWIIDDEAKDDVESREKIEEETKKNNFKAKKRGGWEEKNRKKKENNESHDRINSSESLLMHALPYRVPDLALKR